MDYIDKKSPQFLRATFALFLASFCTYANLWDVQPLLPKLTAEYSVTHSVASLVVSFSSVSLAIGLLVSGFFSESLDRKKLMGTSMVLVTICSLLIIVTPNFEMLLAIRIVQGFTLAGIPAIALAYIGEEFHPQILGRVIGLYIGGTGLGGSCGRLISSLVADFTSWRISILVMALLSIVACIIFFLTIPKSKHFEKKKMDFKQLFGYMGFHLKNEKAILIFVLGFLVMGSFTTFFNYVTFYLLEPPFEWNKWILGWMYVLYIFGIMSSSYFGKLGDRSPRYFTLSIALCFMLAGFCLTFIPNSITALLGIICIIIGFFGSHSTCSAWVGQIVPAHKSQASSLYLFFYYMGASIMGTTGGVFYGSFGWIGVAVFVLIALAIALLSVWRLYDLLHKHKVAHKVASS